MNSPLSKRRLAALLDPRQVCLVEYERADGGFSIVGQWRSAGSFTDIESAVASLLALLRRLPRRRSEIAIAVNQFGAVHFAMTLPSAADDILRSIIQREATRLSAAPDVVVDFRVVQTEPGKGSDGGARARISAIALPKSVISAIGAGLERERVRLCGLTAAGGAAAALYGALDGGSQVTALAIDLASGPIVSFFAGGAIALTLDAPPEDLDEDRSGDEAVIASQIERGRVFLRQLFRGMTVQRILVATTNDTIARLRQLATMGDTPVQPFATTLASGEPAIALGAALVASTRAEPNLGTSTLAGATRTRQTGFRPIPIAAGIAVVAVAWAAGNLISLARERGELRELNTSIAAASSALDETRGIARQRAEHAQDLATVANARIARAQLTRGLVGLASVLPDGLTLDSLAFAPAKDGWQIRLAGRSSAKTSSVAMAQIETFYRSAHQRFHAPDMEVSPLEFRAAQGPDSSAEVRFGMSFTLSHEQGEP